MLVRVADLAQQLLDAVPSVDRFVVGEVEIGKDSQPECGELVAQVPAGGGEAFGGLLANLLVAVHRPVHPGLAQVGRDLHARDGDEAEPRILEPSREQLGEPLLQEVSDPFRPVVRAHRPPPSGPKSSSRKYSARASASSRAACSCDSGSGGGSASSIGLSGRSCISEYVSSSISLPTRSATPNISTSRTTLSRTSLTKLRSLATAVTPTRARCQMSLSPTSAMETL